MLEIEASAEVMTTSLLEEIIATGMKIKRYYFPQKRISKHTVLYHILTSQVEDLSPVEICDVKVLLSQSRQ